MRAECRSNGATSIRLVGESDIERAFIAAMSDACKKSTPPKIKVESVGGTPTGYNEPADNPESVLVVYLEK